MCRRRSPDAFALHDALAQVNAALQPGEFLCAFLDDVYAVSAPHRTRAIYDMLAEFLERVAGIQLHEGKTRVFNTAGREPPDVGALGSEVWSPSGVIVLGTPIGSPAYVAEFARERIVEEKLLWGCSMSPTCNARGRFCFSARAHGVTTHSGRSHPTSPRSTRLRTMKACGKPRRA